MTGWLPTCPSCGDLSDATARVCEGCGAGLLIVTRDAKDDARYRVLKALKNGVLAQGQCAHASRGNCTITVEAHHEDYAKPLEVVWLCGRHHRQLHAERRRTPRPRHRRALAARLARELGVDPRTVAGWQSGRSAPSFGRLIEIARLLKKPPSYFLDGDEERAA